MISKDDLILLKRMKEKSKDGNAFVLKSKNGKTYVSSSSLLNTFEKAKNEKDFEYLLMDYKSINEEKIKNIIKKMGKDFKVYLVKDDKIIEAKT